MKSESIEMKGNPARTNQKQKSDVDSKIRIKIENKTTYPASTLGFSPTGSPSLERCRTGDPGPESGMDEEWSE